MKRMYLILLILTFGFNSCNGFGPTEKSIQTKNIKVSLNELLGKWTMDKFSYKYVTDIRGDSIILKLNKDNTFKLNNSQSLFEGKLDNKINSGSWKFIDKYKTKSIKLEFEESEQSISLNVFKKNKDIQIWYYLSDPDSGKRLRFLK